MWIKDFLQTVIDVKLVDGQYNKEDDFNGEWRSRAVFLIRSYIRAHPNNRFNSDFPNCIVMWARNSNTMSTGEQVLYHKILHAHFNYNWQNDQIPILDKGQMVIIPS